MIFTKLAIVIVNYNQINHTIECIDSLVSSGAKLNQIIVVDNASQDESVKILNDIYGSSLTILALSNNKGYPHGLNKGIPIALNRGDEWVLLMNNDVIVDENFLYELNKATKDCPQASLIGPTILYYDQPEIIWYIGYKIIPGTLIGYRSFRGRKYSSKIPNYVPIDVMHGCTMMVKNSVFQKIGLFDDSNIIYGDDADFSYRARKAGFNMVAATKAKMWHKISLTMGREKPMTRYLRTKNTIAFYKKYSRGLSKIIMFLFTVSKGTITSIQDIFHCRFKLIPPLFFGTIDGWKQNGRKERTF